MKDEQEEGQLLQVEALTEKYDHTITLEIGSNLSWIIAGIVGVIAGGYFGWLV